MSDPSPHAGVQLIYNYADAEDSYIYFRSTPLQLAQLRRLPHPIKFPPSHWLGPTAITPKRANVLLRQAPVISLLPVSGHAAACHC